MNPAASGDAEIDEAELLTALRSGEPVDGAQPDDGGVAGVNRAVPADLLRRCCHELKDQVDPRGLRLRNVVVVGRLDLASLTVPFPLRFDGCEFDSALVVEGADLFELALTGCPRLPGLLGNGLRLRRDLDLSGSQVAGAHWTNASTSKPAAIWLCESEIGGRLLCAGTTIDGQGGRAIQADRIRVGGAVRLIHQFRSLGEVRLLGIRLGGSLDLTSAYLESVDGPALNIDDAIIDGSVFLTEDGAGNRPVIRGWLYMESARISAAFSIRNATIETHPGPSVGSVYVDTRPLDPVIIGSRLSVGAELAMTGQCEVTGGIDLSMADVSRISIAAGCRLRAPGRTALDLTNAEIRASLRLDKDAAVEGTLRLAGAVIHGTLALHGRMEQPERGSLVSGPGLTVDGHVDLDDLRAAGGAVTLTGATLGSLSASRAQLSNADGLTLHLTQSLIRGPVRLIHGFTSTGLVALNRATVEGRLHCTGGTFHSPRPSALNEAGHAIAATAAKVRGNLDLGWTAVSPSVDFTDLTASTLADDPATWPERFMIAGMTYDRLERPQGASSGSAWDPAARIRWLSCQAVFDSGPYEQAAKVFRQHGYTREAEQILIARSKHARRVRRPAARWPERAGNAVYAVIGYGYRPERVLWMLAGLLILTAATLTLPAAQATLRANNGNGQVYTTAGPVTAQAAAGPQGTPSRGSPTVDSCGDGQVRCFSPVLYAIDTVVPLISLDQRATWYPDPHARYGELMLWWLNLGTVLGWLLSSIFVLSLARFSRSS